MLFSLKSLCSSPGGPSGTMLRSSQCADIVVQRSVPSSIAASPRLRQPATPRARNPSGPAEIVQPDRLGIHRMDRGDGLQQHLRQPRADLRPMGEFRRQVLADHQPGAVFDDLEALADDRRDRRTDAGPRAMNGSASGSRDRMRNSRAMS